MRKKIIIILTLMFILIPGRVNANYLVSYHSYGVTNEEKQLMNEANKETAKNVFEEFEYRMFEKEDYDSVDYLILATIITLMVIVIVLLNKKTYLVPSSNYVFLEEKNDNESIESTDSSEKTEKQEKSNSKKKKSE